MHGYAKEIYLIRMKYKVTNPSESVWSDNEDYQLFLTEAHEFLFCHCSCRLQNLAANDCIFVDSSYLFFLLFYAM